MVPLSTDINGGMATDRAEATHVQLTTGDVEAFRRTADLLFGSLFPAVGSVEVLPLPWDLKRS